MKHKGFRAKIQRDGDLWIAHIKGINPHIVGCHAGNKRKLRKAFREVVNDWIKTIRIVRREAKHASIN